LFGCLAKLLEDDTGKFFSDYVTGAIRKATIDYFLAGLIETGFVFVERAVEGSKFPRYQRMKSGSSEAFSMFLFPEERFPERAFLGKYVVVVPEMVDWLDHVNDFLSYYKERVVGQESDTFVENQARVDGGSEKEVLDSMGDMLGKARMKILKSELDEKMKEGLLRWMEGYVVYHLTQNRYRLKEILTV